MLTNQGKHVVLIGLKQDLIYSKASLEKVKAEIDSQSRENPLVIGYITASAKNHSNQSIEPLFEQAATLYINRP
jgi:3-deoxy-D-arabino-heptulosonate 7-phosphate (DAHP) synthase